MVAGRIFLIVLVLAALGACRWPGAELAPGARAAGHGVVYVGSPAGGQIQAVAPWPSPVLLAVSHVPGRARVLGLALDAERGRLWALGEDAVYVHRVPDLRLLARHPLPGGARADALVLESDGRARVRGAGGQWLLDPLAGLDPPAERVAARGR